jgi:hypothetical protein
LAKTTTIHPLPPAPTELAAAIQREMRERNLEIEHLRGVINKTYETARRIHRGKALPGTDTLRLIAEHFDWSPKYAEDLLAKARRG